MNASDKLPLDHWSASTLAPISASALLPASKILFFPYFSTFSRQAAYGMSETCDVIGQRSARGRFESMGAAG